MPISQINKNDYFDSLENKFFKSPIKSKISYILWLQQNRYDLCHRIARTIWEIIMDLSPPEIENPNKVHDIVDNINKQNCNTLVSYIDNMGDIVANKLYPRKFKDILPLLKKEKKEVLNYLDSYQVITTNDLYDVVDYLSTLNISKFHLFGYYPGQIWQSIKATLYDISKANPKEAFEELMGLIADVEEFYTDKLSIVGDIWSDIGSKIEDLYREEL